MTTGTMPWPGRTAALLALVVAVIGVLAFAPAAFSQGSAGETYGGDASVVETQVTGGGGASADPGDTNTTSASGLPFTGLDIGFALGGGLLLLATGFGVSRMVHHPPTT